MSKGAETRKRVIAKAAPLFNKQGFDGCSMQDVVAVSGLEKGSIYGHFASKESLAAEAFDYAWAETCAARIKNMSSIPNSVEKLKVHAKNCASATQFSGGCPLMNTAVDADDGNTTLRARARQALRNWQRLLQDIVEEGQKKGEIRRDLNPEAVSSIMISLLEGASSLDRIERSPTLRQHAGMHLEWYLDHFVRLTTR